MHLPEKFQKEMEILLGDEYQAFKESYDRQPENGLRLNRRKVTGEEFLTRTPFLLKKIPWIDNGYTYGTGTPAKDPYYYAGLYYLQEPSAIHLLTVCRRNRVIMCWICARHREEKRPNLARD